MKSFSYYFKYRENMIGNSEKDAPLNPSDSDEMSVLFKIIRLAWKNHRQDTRAFIKDLARRSPEVAAEFERLNQDDAVFDRSSSEKEKLMMPDADKSGST